MEMPIMSTQPNTAPASAAESAAEADAPQGAFEEMLARRLGRQLVGRFAREHGEPEPKLDRDPTPWMPPAATNAPAGGEPESEPSSVSPPTLGPLRTDPIAGAPQPVPIRISVNRPGFPTPMAEPGTIQPGPNGEVWTHPSGFADLQLTRGRATVPDASADGTPSLLAPDGVDGPIGAVAVAPAPGDHVAPEPPEVHWSPAPARAALAAAANRDLELEIVTKMAQQVQRSNTSEPQLRLLEASTPDSVVTTPPPVAFDAGAATLDAAGIGSPTPAAPAGSAPSAGLIERVMNAVEMQQHLPPPRAIAIEIPEIEGLRLLVTMRMDGSVHVASSGTTAQVTSDQVTPLLQAVNDALTERGFDMSADTGGHQSARDDTHEEPVRPRTARFRRTARRNGLRI